jgi:L-rhamnose mutarotase
MRIAFVMQVHPEHHEEYVARHNPIWSELEETLKAHGVLNYSIFLDAQTHQLFAYAEIEDLERWQAIANTEVCRRWWRHMSPIMPSNADGSPVARELREVFHIERAN